MKSTNQGTGIIEAIVVISVMSVAFAAILSAAAFFLRGGLFAADQAAALFLLDESAEAVRFMRDNGYSVYIEPHIGAGNFYLEPIANGWTATTTNDLVLGKYERSVALTEVYRRTSDDNIVPAASSDLKVLDSGTARLDITVHWKMHEVHATTYITDLYEN